MAVGGGVADEVAVGGINVAVGSSGAPHTVTPADGSTANVPEVTGRPSITVSTEPDSTRIAADCVWDARVGGRLIWNGMGWRLPSA